MEKEALMEKFIGKLRDEKYKVTDQRRDILEVIVTHRQRHFTAEELYEEVSEINPDLGLATVYRNLELFCQLDFIHRLDFDTDHRHYELLESRRHHHHMICLECDEIIEFNDKDLEDFERKLEEEYNFISVNHFIKFYGYCDRCEGEGGKHESH